MGTVDLMLKDLLLKNSDSRFLSEKYYFVVSKFGLKVVLKICVIRLYFKKRIVGRDGYLEIAYSQAFKKFELQVIVIRNT